MLLIEYDAATGRTTNVMSVWPPDMPDHLASLGRPFLLAQPPAVAACMVVAGALQLRPPCPATVTVEGRMVTVAGLPEGSAIAAETESLTVPVPAECPVTTIEADEGGAFTLKITPPWPYLEAEHDVSIADV